MTKAYPTIPDPCANPSPETMVEAHAAIAHRLFKIMTKKQRADAIKRLNRESGRLNSVASDRRIKARECCDLPDNVHPIRGNATTAKERAAKHRADAAELDSRAEAMRAIVFGLSEAFK